MVIFSFSDLDQKDSFWQVLSKKSIWHTLLEQSPSSLVAEA